MKSYSTFAATYLASFTLAHVFLKATDLSLETTDGLLKWSANEKVCILIDRPTEFDLKVDVHQVDPVLVGLRKLRSDAEHLRKQGVGLNGTEKVSS